jgi:3-hydroxyisobutyrate dehydrogenase-like beta-hydroxyacid dehydrogenase
MAAKVLQNGLGLVQLVAMAEVAAACRTQGIDPRLFHRLTMEAGGMAASPLFEHRFSLMDLGSETVEARLAIGAKDSKLHRDLIGGVAADFSPASASAAAFAAALAAGLEDADVTAVWRVFEKVKPIPADPIP